MSDRQRQQLLEEQEEVFLQALFDEAAEAEGEVLQRVFAAEQEAGTEPEIPEALNAKCRELIRASEKKQRKCQVRKFVGIGLKRVAVIALVCIGIISALVISVDAIKVPVMNLFVMNQDRYSTIFFGSKQPEERDLMPGDKVLSTRLPSGFELISIDQLQNGAFCYYFENKTDETIQVSIMPATAMIDFDTEDAEQREMTVYEWPAIFIKKNGYRIIWYNSELNYVYDVNSSDLNETEFLEYVYRLAK